jgi:hypothetical protein
MKNFETINQLWEYLLVCPFCKKDRKIELSIGPDEVFNFIDWKKSKNVLNITFNTIIESASYVSTWKIDCNTNKFGINTETIHCKHVKLTSSLPSADYSNLYFYAYSDCKHCNCSFSNTSDLCISKNSYLTIDNILIEREGFYLKKNDNNHYYVLVADYYHDKMYVHSVKMLKGAIKEKNKEITLPLLDFDFSNHEKMLNKITTILLLK